MHVSSHSCGDGDGSGDGDVCAPAKPTIRTRKRMRASRGAAPKRTTDLRQADS
jgi:hypothetical protein